MSKKMEHKFITYIRTKMLFQQRLRHLSNNSIFVHKSDLLRFNVSIELLHHFIKIGEISHENNRYKALNAGTVDMALIKRKGAAQTELHKWMKQILMFVDLPENIDAPDYFTMFLKYRNEYLDLFFTVDEFAGRVHTPVSSLSHEIRPYLLLCGENTVSFDVSQMQPTLLANILYQNVGENAFSAAIFEGVDVYTMLQGKAGLSTRNEAKKRFFEMLFSKPSQQMEKLFESANFIQWINNYKSIIEPRNPHTNQKPYSNLAWLLQNYEVSVMSSIWRKLAENGIPFLSVHDEIICRQSDKQKAQLIFSNELSKHLSAFKISLKETTKST
jgi:hypothetical protein